MSLFDSIVSGVADKLGLGDKAGSLATSLLGMITNKETGGFGGFLDKFRAAGLGSKVDSWISGGDNKALTGDEVTAALGGDAVSSLAASAGVDGSTAATALGEMIPQTVDRLTPDGVIPDEGGLLDTVKDAISGWGGAAVGAVLGAAGIAGAAASGVLGKAGDVAGGAVDAVGNVAGKGIDLVGDAAGAVTGAAGATVGAVGDVAGKGVDAVKDVAGATVGAVGNVAGKGVDMVGDAAGATMDAGKKAVGAVTDVFDGDGDSGGLLKWLLPLILLGLLILLGYWFCGKGGAPSGAANGNANANKPAANANANTNANMVAPAGEKKLSEVVLPDGTKLQAFPGGIEDQLVKFIQSDEYKNGTADTLKEKWFSFDDLNFVFGKTELTPESKRQLDNIVAILKAFPTVKMKIGGYTDKKGVDADNKKLSDARAKAVKAEIEKAGVGAQVPEAEGYGEEFAKVPETGTDEERKADRKTAVRLIKDGATAKPAEANAAKPTDANTAKPAAANAAANTTR